MNDIGFLSPAGELTPCESFEHLDVAKELAEKLSGEKYYNRLLAEEYLLDKGYVVVRARDVYASLGYIHYKEGDDTFYHLTDEQKQWLIAHYDSFPRDKQEEVDRLIRHFG